MGKWISLKRSLLVGGMVAMVLFAILAACSGPVEKRDKFFAKGKTLYEQADYVRARLELKNAIQIDPKFAQGYFQLGLVELKAQDYQKAYGYLAKAVELDPALLQAQVELGRLMLAGKMLDKALEKAELVLAAEPANSGAIVLKAAVLLNQKKESTARTLLEGLLRQGVSDPDVYALLALTLQRQGQADQAKAMLAQGVTAHPDSVKLLKLSAGICLQAKDFKGAEAVMQRVIALEPGQTSHRLQLAELYWQNGQQSEALAAVAALVGSDNSSPDVRIAAAKFLVHHSRLEEAEKLLRDGIAATPENFQLRFALSEVLIQRHRPAEAVEALRACLDLKGEAESPEKIEARSLLAKAMLVQGDLKGAEEMVAAVLKVSPQHVAAHYTKGLLHMLRKQPGDAIAEFRTVVAERPEFVEGHLRLAEAHLLKDERELALDTLRSATKALPDSKVLLRALAKVYVSQKDTANAKDSLERLRAIDPNDLSVYASLGDLLAAGGQPDKAAAQYQLIRDKAPDNPLGHLKLSQLYWSQGRREEAIEVLKKATAAHPDSQVLLTNLVKAHMAMGKADAAVAVCREELARDPQQAFVCNLLGAVFMQQKQYDAAETQLEQAITLRPNWQVPHANLARLYLLKGQTQKAIARYKSALAVNPQNPGTYMTLGKLYEQQKDYPNAMQIYEQALAVNPSLWPAANNLAFLLSEFGQGPEDLERAMRLGLQASDLRPDDPMVQDTVAWISFKQGNLPMARQILEEALAKAPQDAVLNYHMGAVLAKSGDRLDARERLSAALAGDDRFPGRKEAEDLLRGLK